MIRFVSTCVFLLVSGTCFASPQYQNPGGSTLPTSCGHFSYDCVPYYLCQDGVIVTDGGGLIDVRLGRPEATCSNPEYPDVPGICCLKPGYDPTPSPIDNCPKYQTCVAYDQCGADGTVVTDGSGLINIRTQHESCWLPNHKGHAGRCCFPPPVYIDNCPASTKCTSKQDCLGQAYDSLNQLIDYGTPGAIWSHCKYGGVDGVCCVQPKIDKCPGKSVCVPANKCKGKALAGANNFFDYSSTAAASWSLCTGYGGVDGVCCIQSKIDKCPGKSVCVPANECKGQALAGANQFFDYISTAATSWSLCTGYDNGVCCINPVNKCGVLNNLDTRITSGGSYSVDAEAGFGEIPWQALIFYSNYTFKCGAALISDTHLVTGAHCVNGLYAADIRIRLGEWKVSDFSEPLPYVDYDVKAIYQREDFNPRNLHNNIGVIELAKPAALDYHINTICLPPPGYVTAPKTKCIVSGWGKDTFEGDYQQVLKRLEIPYVKKQKCQRQLQRTRLGEYFQLDDSLLCAGGEPDKDACTGDGGGPLACPDATGHYVLTGVTSFGVGCGQKDVPGVYADVAKFSSWINDIIVKTSAHNYGYGK